MTPAAERCSARDLYAALGFERYAHTQAAQLSGVTRSKLNLGLALLADPAVLLLDEPYAGFDFDTYLKFWDLVARRRTAGRSALIISHFVTDEERFDRIVTLRDGKAVPDERHNGCREAARTTAGAPVPRWLRPQPGPPADAGPVPVAFVAAAGGSVAQLGRLLSGTMAPSAAVQTVTAGWAAAFIAAIAAYFQVRAARAAGRRLVLPGLPAGRRALGLPA
jgi:energy-coupling factor transporter ATP-binding protein EcfA2